MIGLRFGMDGTRNRAREMYAVGRGRHIIVVLPDGTGNWMDVV